MDSAYGDGLLASGGITAAFGLALAGFQNSAASAVFGIVGVTLAAVGLVMVLR